MKQTRILLLCAFDPGSTFSYHTAWPRHFAAHPAFQCMVVNLLEGGALSRVRATATLAVRRFDAIVMLHSVFSNGRVLAGLLFDAVKAVRAPKVFFIGNEYKLMPEKMAFCDEVGLALLISQSSAPEIHRLYKERLGCEVAGIPNTGLDPVLFAPHAPRAERPIDLGYRADDSPPYLGHQERREMAEFFQRNAERFGLSVDISLDPQQRFTEPDWAGFLNRCKGQLGTEAGGDFFDLEDRPRRQVNAYVREHPDAPFKTIYDTFLRSYDAPVSLRILSGRNVEAAGTRTVQILFEGRYDGYFEPDVHYIPLKKDFSNVDDAVAKFKDPAVCDRLTQNAYDVAMELTYDKLIDRFRDHLRGVL